MAVALGIVLHFGSWIPTSFVTPESYFNWSTGTKIGISLVPNMGFQFGFMLIWFRETDGSGGMDWSSITEPTNGSDNLTLGHIWLCNLISICIFNLILWYMDNVRPGKYGVAQKLYFPFQVNNFLIYQYFTNVDLRNLTGVGSLRILILVRKRTCETKCFLKKNLLKRKELRY